MFKILIHEGDTKDERLSYFDTNSPSFLEQKSAAGGRGRGGGGAHPEPPRATLRRILQIAFNILIEATDFEPQYWRQ